ncbi:MAG: radical SAM protein [Myxococcota bacterium]
MHVALVRPLINEERNAPLFLPLGLLSIAASVRQDGHSVSVHDFELAHRLGEADLTSNRYLDGMCERILTRAPTLVGITVLADSLPMGLLLGRALKARSPGVRVAFGGPGVFGTTPELQRRFPDAVDYVCKGEGELATRALAAELARGLELPAVAGFSRTAAAGPVDDGPVPLCDLDSLPGLAYDLVDLPTYLELASPRIFDLYVGTGCTYACSFCTIAPFWERKFRAKSPAAIFAELTELNQKYGITRVNFLHDNFSNKRDYLDGFLDYFEEHNTQFEWACAVRPDNLPLDVTKRMRRAGCFSMFCGVDSGSTKILKMMRKLPNSSKSYTFFETCKIAGIQLETNTIIGYPDESDRDLEDTLTIIFDSVASGFSGADLSILQPLPGAPVTASFREHIQPVESNTFGAFRPPEIEQLVREHLDLFTGFGFIRYNNRPYAFYEKLIRLVRFFCRHSFRSLFLMKKAGIASYVEAMTALAETTDDPSQFGEALRQWLLQRAEGTTEHRRALVDSLQFDAAVDAVRGIDVLSEVVNPYLPAQGDTPRWAIVRTEVPLHSVFARLPEVDLAAIRSEPTQYLIYNEPSDSLVVLRLKPWQTALLSELIETPREPSTNLAPVTEKIIEQLSAGRSLDREVVRSKVSGTAALFWKVLAWSRAPAQQAHV